MSVGYSTAFNSNFLDSDTSFEFSYDFGNGISNTTSIGTKPEPGIFVARIGLIVLMNYLVPGSSTSTRLIPAFR